MTLRRQPMFAPLFVAATLAIVAVSILGWLAWPQPPATVIVVRHAEKLDGPDPGLSESGHARAERLAETFAPAGISTIHASDTRRARETAAPIAARLSLPVQLYDPHESQALAVSLRRNGQVTLVVGHSDTVPLIVHGLSGHEVGEIDEERYGDIFIVVRPRWGRAVVTRTYQAPHLSRSR